MGDLVIVSPDGSVTAVARGVDIHKYAKTFGGEVISSSDYTPQEDVISPAKDWRDSELRRSDIEINKVQDGDGVGTLKAWREYRRFLRAWPSTDGFPSTQSRPSAPDLNN